MGLGHQILFKDNLNWVKASQALNVDLIVFFHICKHFHLVIL